MSVLGLPGEQSLCSQPSDSNLDAFAVGLTTADIINDFPASLLLRKGQGEGNLLGRVSNNAELHVEATGLHNHSRKPSMQWHDSQLSPVTGNPFSQEKPSVNQHCRMRHKSSKFSRAQRRKSPRRSSNINEQRKGTAQGHKLLERNRIAATKCRQKKKEETSRLESRYREQSQKREALVAETARLRLEATDLKNEALKHAECDDKSITQYLTQSIMTIASKGTTLNFALPSATSSPSVETSPATTKSETTSPITQLTIPPGRQEWPLFGWSAEGLIDTKPQQVSWGSTEPPLFDEPMDSVLDDLLNL